jgi:hypothetical protein
MKVLLFQNKKLTEKIEQRRKAEEELRKRIEQLEKRQTTDDAVLCIVNRYWNQVRTLLHLEFSHCQCLLRPCPGFLQCNPPHFMFIVTQD